MWVIRVRVSLFRLVWGYGKGEPGPQKGRGDPHSWTLDSNPDLPKQPATITAELLGSSYCLWYLGARRNAYECKRYSAGLEPTNLNTDTAPVATPGSRSLATTPQICWAETDRTEPQRHTAGCTEPQDPPSSAYSRQYELQGNRLGICDATSILAVHCV